MFTIYSFTFVNETAFITPQIVASFGEQLLIGELHLVFCI